VLYKLKQRFFLNIILPPSHKTCRSHPSTQFIFILAKKPVIHFNYFKSGLQIKLQIWILLAVDRCSVAGLPRTRTPAYGGHTRPHAHELPDSIVQDANELADASIVYAEEVPVAGRGESTRRPAGLLAALPPTAVLLPSSFSPTSAVPSSSAAEERIHRRIWALPRRRGQRNCALTRRRGQKLSPPSRFTAEERIR
jgi:hypothetical protein